MKLVAVVMAIASAAQAADNVSGPAYALINSRTSQNQSQFFVFEDADSPFNHGFPSGLFGSSTAAMAKLHTNPSCVYSASAANGCSVDPTATDPTRGTVFQFTFDPLVSGEDVGLNFEEPENWGVNRNGIGYDLTGVAQLAFDAISPTGGIQVQFSVNGFVGGYVTIPRQWTPMTINLSSLGITTLSGVHLLLGIASKDVYAPNGGTVLLDNIRFLPVPASQAASLALPLANQVFGIEHVQNALSGSIPIPPDEINSNLATVYESSLAIIALIARGQTQDLANAKLIANTLTYALANDNQGDPLPAPGGPTGLHNGMFAGDIKLFNNQGLNQGPAGGRQGQVRLSGFTAPGLCQATGFCLLLDGATGGNNAFGILGLLSAYKQFQDPAYLNAALTIGNWILNNLLDPSGTGYGGYFVGYPDQGLPKVLQMGKSTENNADIFAAFTALANAENAAGNAGAAAMWTARANVAGDFVMQMYDKGTGHFFAGTVPAGQAASAGIYPTGEQKGNDIINTFDFLDTETFTTLAMASAPRYQSLIDWHLPVQWVVDHFQSTVTAAGLTFQGFDLIRAFEHLPTDGPAGIAWEFTGQEVAAMKLVDALYDTSQFGGYVATYLNQIQQAQMEAPFTDGQGIVASTMQNGGAVIPYQQCFVTPYQCIAERVGLAATIWGIVAEAGLDPFLVVAMPVQFPSVFIDAPAANSTLSGTVAISGWAIENIGAAGPYAVSSVKVFVDGIQQPGTATYGGARPDVCVVFPARMGCPNVGWNYSLNVSALALGSHTLTITATDTAGNSGSSQTTFVVVLPPSVFIDTPAANSTLSGTVAIGGWAIENIGAVGPYAVSSLKVFVDGVQQPGAAAYGGARPDVCVVFPARPGCPNVGWNYSLNVSALALGSHTLTITATDTAGNSGSSQTNFMTIQPSVFIDTPAANSTLSGTVTIGGWAIENIAVVGPYAVSSVKVFVDGIQQPGTADRVARPDVCVVFPARLGCPNVGWNYSLNVTALTSGTHTLTIVATDTAGNSGSSQTNFVVVLPPSVFIDSPAANSTLSGTVAIGGWAIESIGAAGPYAVSSVKVFLDGTQQPGTAAYGVARPDVCVVFPARLGCPNVGWNYSLNVSALASGTHTLTIMATDTAGSSGSSQTNFVTLQPSVSIDAPAANP